MNHQSVRRGGVEFIKTQVVSCLALGFNSRAIRIRVVYCVTYIVVGSICFLYLCYLFFSTDVMYDICHEKFFC